MRRSNSGFTLLELILVIALMATVYAVALPDLTILDSTAVANKMGRLASDIRGAYDQAVLSQKPYRLVFRLYSGEYWLEETTATNFVLGDNELGRDLTEEEEKDQKENFENDFGLYVELAGTEVEDGANERVLPPMSPVLKAKEALRPTPWTRVDNVEWKVRSLGPELIIQDFRALHHDQKQTFDELGEAARAMIYFFPNGYVEPAVIHIAYREGDSGFNTDKQPYTVVTEPYEGIAQVISGYEEIEFHEHFKAKKP